jgi:hypothetical protein
MQRSLAAFKPRDQRAVEATALCVNNLVAENSIFLTHYMEMIGTTILKQNYSSPTHLRFTQVF